MPEDASRWLAPDPAVEGERMDLFGSVAGWEDSTQTQWLINPGPGWHRLEATIAVVNIQTEIEHAAYYLDNDGGSVRQFRRQPVILHAYRCRGEEELGNFCLTAVLCTPQGWLGIDRHEEPFIDHRDDKDENLQNGPVAWLRPTLGELLATGTWHGLAGGLWESSETQFCSTYLAHSAAHLLIGRSSS
ncbi:hypothetical protein ACIO6T_30945 [Streptomyces sp. NPDC087532]|uniref:hypothetical protein n=1 Tax=Streptomyces sp. NPDC087532 TaxID=3365795 RepID=UPI00382E6BB3